MAPRSVGKRPARCHRWGHAAFSHSSVSSFFRSFIGWHIRYGRESGFSFFNQLHRFLTVILLQTFDDDVVAIARYGRAANPHALGLPRMCPYSMPVSAKSPRRYRPTSQRRLLRKPPASYASSIRRFGYPSTDSKSCRLFRWHRTTRMVDCGLAAFGR